MARKKIPSLKGKTVAAVHSSGSYVIIVFEDAAQLQVAADHVFDKHGDRYENDAPLLSPPRGRR